MGCPPSPEEKDMGRFGHMIRVSLEKYEGLKPQYIGFFSLVERLLKKNMEAGQREQLIAILQLNIVDTDVPQDMNGPTGNDAQFYSWLSDYGNCADENTEKIKRLEISLCNARCLFYKLALENKMEADEAEKQQINFQIEEYRKHREEDRQTWIAWLKKEKECGDSYFEREDENDRIMSEHAQRVISGEIRKTETFTSEEMMLDCFLFGRDPEKFDFYNLFFGGKRA
jgi:hypothetical protein